MTMISRSENKAIIEETTEASIEWSSIISIDVQNSTTIEPSISTIEMILNLTSLTSDEIETTVGLMPTTTDAQKPSKNSRSRLGLIVGATLGAIILLISLIAVAYFLYTKCITKNSSVMPSSGLIRSDLTSHT